MAKRKTMEEIAKIRSAPYFKKRSGYKEPKFLYILWATFPPYFRVPIYYAFGTKMEANKFASQIMSKKGAVTMPVQKVPYKKVNQNNVKFI